jgi:hypothetical protein
MAQGHAALGTVRRGRGIISAWATAPGNGFASVEIRSAASTEKARFTESVLDGMRKR